MKKNILFVLIVIALITLACGFGDVTGLIVGSAAETPTERPPLVEPTQGPQKFPTPEPTPMKEGDPTPKPTKPPAPTEELTGPQYFREEFDGAINWTYEYLSGNTQEQCVGPDLANGQLHWSCRSGEETHIKFYEDVHIYEDVAIQVETVNFGSNTNWTALMCRVNEQGWIEFRFSSGGLFEIYRFDWGLHHAGKTPYVFIGSAATPYLKSGKTNNLVTMVCQGDNFEFYANGNQIDITIPPKYREEYAKLKSGGVGVGFYVMADNPAPVDIGIEWFETFEP